MNKLSSSGGLSIGYESVEEANMRLSNTIVMYDGEPMYVTGVARADDGDPSGEIFRVYCQPLPYAGADGLRNGGEGMRKYISSKKFDLRTIPLGFMNHSGSVHLIVRTPARQYKQGLSSNSLLCQPLSSGVPPLNFNRLIKAKEFVDTILGKYPSFDEATAILGKGKASAVAFDRHFALAQDPEFEEMKYLFYKTNKIGIFFENAIKLSKNALCFTEYLNELGVRL